MRLFNPNVSTVGVLVAAASLLACDPAASSRDPQPGLAKFALARADAVRWVGTDGCDTFDLRTGREGSDPMTKVVGQVFHACTGNDQQFEFIYRQHAKDLTPASWTTAWRPLNVHAAEVLIDNCTWESRPDPAGLVGQWWRANNTYAENTVLGYIAPLALASGMVPFDDDGHERLGEERFEGVDTVVFENASARVWMVADRDDHRPLRVVRADGTSDVRFSEWDVPFAAELPAELRELSEVCEVQ